MIKLIVIVVAVIVFLILLMASYVKSSPNQALVISGLSKKPRYLVGKGGFRIPFLEKTNKLYLGQVTVDIKTKESIPTNDFINVRIDAVAKVQVDMTPTTFENAIKNFLDCRPEYIAKEVQDTFEGNLRESVGAVALKDLNIDRDAFSDQVLDKATKDLSALGLKVLSCNIQNISDENGLISDLGADNVYKIKKEAAITKANAQKEISVAESQAKKEANDVRVQSEVAIAEKNNELIIRTAELKKQSDLKKADADAAYEIQKQVQQKVINEKTVDARITQVQREQLLADEEVKLTENRLKAQVNKAADAEKYKVETEASARLEKDKKDAEANLIIAQRKAEAEKYAIEQEAEAIKSKASAERFAKEQEAAAIKALGEANAYRIEQEGKAEAERVKALALAEAEGLEKKAEAYDKYGAAAKLDMLVQILPEVARSVAEPMSAIQNLNIYSSDGSGAGAVSGQMPAVVKQTLDVIESLGVPVTGIMEANTKSAKTDRNIDINGEVPISVAE